MRIDLAMSRLVGMCALVCGSFSLASGPASAVTYNDGAHHVYNTPGGGLAEVTNVGCTAYCSSPVGAPTHLEVVSPGGYTEAWLYGTSTLTISGGLVSNIELYNDANVIVTALPSPISTLSAGGTSSVTIVDGVILGFVGGGDSESFIQGGVIDALPLMTGNHVSTQTGGDVRSPFLEQSALHRLMGGMMFGIEIKHDATLEVSGGILMDVEILDQGRLLISGGETFGPILARDDALIRLSGGDPSAPVILGENALLEVRGTDFLLDGAPVPYGELATHVGLLSGVLEDATPFALDLRHHAAHENDRVVLIDPNASEPEDEPPAVPSFGTWGHVTLVLAIGAGALRAARRSRGNVCS